jgi:hypothetical protein
MGTTKSREASLAESLIAGTKKHFSAASSLAFEGGTFTPAQVEASLQTLADLRSAVDDAKAAAKTKIAAELAQAPALRSHMAAFVSFVRATFGNSPDVLADFGLAPKKAKKQPTAEEKAAASAKRKATRAARSTMGRVQKSKVRGDVTGITVTPITAAKPVVQPPATSAPTQGTGGAGTPHAS